MRGGLLLLVFFFDLDDSQKGDQEEDAVYYGCSHEDVAEQAPEISGAGFGCTVLRNVDEKEREHSEGRVDGQDYGNDVFQRTLLSCGDRRVLQMKSISTTILLYHI